MKPERTAALPVAPAGASHSAGRTASISPGKSGATRSASRAAGRPSTSGARSSKRSSSAMFGAIWKSAALSSGPPSSPSSIQASILSRRCGQGREILLRGAVGRAVAGAREADHERARHALHGPHERVAVAIDARERPRLQPRRAEHEASRRVLEGLAPALGGLDGRARCGIGRKQRRPRDELVERARDLPRALDAPAVDLQRRDGHRHEAAPEHAEGVWPDEHVHGLVVEVLVLEHQPCRHRRGRAVEHVELDLRCHAIRSPSASS